ncbi:MAG: hypothetical protein KBB11_04310 [Bacteroidales bacterium]|nr:hypothetical protein [Bacteroidales bacterium]HOY38468.1 hypothetical protein [Bacteroidales bacterium]HQN93575.1 hypothetical protein [Prolixibacteraceae bacterium]
MGINGNYINKTAFKVPEGYFDDLPDNIMSKVKRDHKPRVRTIDIIKPWLYMAASFIVLAIFIKIGLNLVVDKKSVNPDTSKTENFTAYNDFEESLLSDELVFMEAITETPQEAGISEVSSEAIEEYLLNYDLTAELEE